MTKPNNPPAFPTNQNNQYQTDGMTLRDWFAGQALQGWLASYSTEAIHPSHKAESCEEVAREAYLLADAMLAERSKNEE